MRKLYILYFQHQTSNKLGKKWNDIAENKGINNCWISVINTNTQTNLCLTDIRQNDADGKLFWQEDVKTSNSFMKDQWTFRAGRKQNIKLVILAMGMRLLRRTYVCFGRGGGERLFLWQWEKKITWL